MNSSQLIEKLNRFYDKLGSDKKYSFLITGNWGIGKTYTYNEFIKGKDQVYYYSLFGISELRELEKMILKDVIFPTFNKLNSERTPKVLGSIVKGVLKDVTKFTNTLEAISPNNILEALTFRDLEFTPKSLICLDDLERCKIPMEDLMGFIERLKQRTNVIILCNEDEVNESIVYRDYKEKVIDFSYSLTDIEDKIILGKLSLDLKLSGDMENIILQEFKKHCKDNLRVLERFIHLFRELIFDLEEKQLKQRAKEKLLKACFYLACEESLNLIEDYLERKRSESKGDLRESYIEIWRGDIYLYVYNFSGKELMVELQKYSTGAKENLDRIVKKLRVEIEETKELIEDKLKLYFFMDKSSVETLYDEIEKFIEKSDLEYYVSSEDLLEIYVHYIYFSQVIGKKLKKETVEDLEKYIFKFYKKTKRIDSTGWLEKDLVEIRKDLISKLSEKFEAKNQKEDLEKIKLKLNNKEYDEISEIVEKLEILPDFLYEYLRESLSRAITLEEWKLWSCIVSNLSKEDREKIKEILKENKVKDVFMEKRILYFTKNNKLNI